MSDFARAPIPAPGNRIRTTGGGTRPRHRDAGGAAALTLALVLTLAGCTNGGEQSLGGTADPGVGTSADVRLTSFESCDAAADRLQTAAAAHMTSRGFPDVTALSQPVPAQRELEEGDTGARAAAPQRAAAAPERAAVADGATAGAAHSGTNVHEYGADEPDLVKTDGRRIVSVVDGTLRMVDARTRTETATLPLPDAGTGSYRAPSADLFLHGDRALVLRNGAIPEPLPGTGILPPTHPDPASLSGPRVLLVDLTGAPRVVAEYEVDGALVDARATGATARVVVRSAPRVGLPSPEPATTDEERLEANRAAVREASLADWLPRYRLTADGETTTGQVDCTALRHPEQYTGTNLLTVLSFDLGAGTLGDGNPVSVVADGDTVYSDGDSLYVANDQRATVSAASPASPASTRSRVLPDTSRPRGPVTELYKFDVSGAGPPRYVAGGVVPGWLVDQYAMSRWDGHLRVATTGGGMADPDRPRLDSAVHVLTQRGDALVEVGSVDGLGVDERIYSVRFQGPLGYVVTFRETDPLYTVDLSDPTAPVVRGELKITGYSSYLHPVGDGRLLGVGQEADLRGVTQGTQVSLFEVSDLEAPAVLDQYEVAGGRSEAESDPHAFLWWAPERLAVVPVAVPPGSGTQRAGASAAQGALVLRVNGGQVSANGLISHPSGGSGTTPQIRRSLVIGDTLWTLSAAGLQADDLDTMRTTGWVPFD